MCRRVYALWKAFEDVNNINDWKQPCGSSGKWKSKVKWHLADEYDALALEGAELIIDEADDEVRKRMEKKTLFSRYATKADPSPVHDADG